MLAGAFFHTRFPAFAAATSSQARELGLHGRRLGVAIRLIAFEHQVRNGHQFACCGYHRHIAILLFGQPAEKYAQRAGMLIQVLGRFNEHPPRMAVALLGNRAVVAVFRRLMRRWRQAQIAGGMIAILEAVDVPKSRQ